ncbi:MAG: HD domain-containing protein [bacterium]|nr:HD domain-containing protein [bacterium]
MSNLQLHMLRVAGVSSLICNYIGDSINSREVITACLLHDMGNIIKFDLKAFPQYLEPEGLSYWEEVKSEYIVKYGRNEHDATGMILVELGVSNSVKKLVGAVGFSNAIENLNSKDIARQICAYSDMRLKPERVCSLSERFEDGAKRYKITDEQIKAKQIENAKALFDIERQLCGMGGFLPESLSDVAIKDSIVGLSEYDILVV